MTWLRYWLALKICDVKLATLDLGLSIAQRMPVCGARAAGELFLRLAAVIVATDAWRYACEMERIKFERRGGAA